MITRSHRPSPWTFIHGRESLGSKQDEALRLFMVPGMNHCRGGDGADQFDAVAAMERWREEGSAPKSMLAIKVQDNKVERTRLLCPFPQIAKYRGGGSTGAGNFVCAAP